MQEVIKLKKEFIGRGEVKGFNFKQIFDSKDFYIYQVNDRYYEVFKKKIKKCSYNNRFYEKYPTANAFGSWAWTYETLDECYNKIKNLGYRINDPCVIIEK